MPFNYIVYISLSYRTLFDRFPMTLQDLEAIGFVRNQDQCHTIIPGSMYLAYNVAHGDIYLHLVQALDEPENWGLFFFKHSVKSPGRILNCKATFASTQELEAFVTLIRDAADQDELDYLLCKSATPGSPPRTRTFPSSSTP